MKALMEVLYFVCEEFDFPCWAPKDDFFKVLFSPIN